MRTANEKIMDRIVRHRQFVIGLENAAIRELNKELAAARKDVLDQLVAASSGTLSPQDIQILTAQIDARLKEAKDQITAALGQKLQAAYDTEGAATFNILRASLPVVARKMLSFMPGSGKEIKDILKFAVHGVTYEQAVENLFNRLGIGVSKEVRNAFAESFHKALAAGTEYRGAVEAAVTSAEALEKKVKVVRDLFDQKAKKELAGIVRNHTQRALDEAQTHVYKQNEHLLQGVVYTATLDMKTCPRCAALDGTMYWMGKVPRGESGELFADKPELPLHPGCRCTYAPIVKSWQDLPVREEDIPKSSKRLLDGDIPRPKKYEEWFNEQSTSTQVDILGKARYELWKSGQVSLTDMATVDKTLSVEELLQKVGDKQAVKEIQKAAIVEGSHLPIGTAPPGSVVLSSNEGFAVRMWTRGAYKDIRNLQLGRPLENPDKARFIKKDIERLEKVCAKIKPYSGTVYRGANVTQEMWGQIQETGVVRWKAFCSSSEEKETAQGFIRAKHIATDRVPVLFEIENKSGVQISRWSAQKAEKEVLLRPGATYKVKKIAKETRMGGAKYEAREYYRVVLEEVL